MSGATAILRAMFFLQQPGRQGRRPPGRRRRRHEREVKLRIALRRTLGRAAVADAHASSPAIAARSVT
jgi:hypothetical protein